MVLLLPSPVSENAPAGRQKISQAGTEKRRKIKEMREMIEKKMKKNDNDSDDTLQGPSRSRTADQGQKNKKVQ